MLHRFYELNRVYRFRVPCQSKKSEVTVTETASLDVDKCGAGIHIISDIEGDFAYLSKWLDSLVIKGALIGHGERKRSRCEYSEQTEGHRVAW